MAEASIPVDLFNPGQVFACLGFLEAADVLCGDAEGGFDWRSNEADVRFQLRSRGDENPFSIVLGFIAKAQLRRLAPVGYADPSPKGRKGSKKQDQKDTSAGEEVAADRVTNDSPLCLLKTFPRRQADRMTLPIRLVRDGWELDITHWCDASSRNHFKLFAGQQRAPAIAKTMIDGLTNLWEGQHGELIRDPFGVTVPMGGSSFKFDARKSWTGLDAGYSPDEQKHLVVASPVVEILAAIGLEHARPDEHETRHVRYAAWSSLLPPMLARPALAGSSVGVPMRRFSFELALSGKNKVVTFAREEISP